MVDDKYIGLALACSSSLAIGTSFILTKKGLEAAGKNNEYVKASDNLSYLKSPIWWAGMSTMVIGEIANFAAYLFAPPILVTPLGALSVLIGAVLASFFLKEELGHIGRVGCTLCFIGSLIIVLHAPPDKDIQTVDEMLHYAIQPGFLMYCLTVLVFTLIMIYAVAPKHGQSNPLIYISICSLVGSVSVMAIKGFGVALKLTLSGSNQFSHPSTYVFAIIVVVCILVQVNYLNKALDTFSTNVVNPMYYVGFSTSVLVASLILFQGLNTTDGITTISLLVGFVITFLGVHLLNISREPEPPQHPHNAYESVLEHGIMNPRMSISGRLSLDGWNGPGAGGMMNGYRNDGAPFSANHGRRSSLYRHQSSTLYSSFGDDEEVDENSAARTQREQGQEAVGLRRLREDPRMEVESEEEDDMSDADERTKLRSGSGMNAKMRSGGSSGVNRQLINGVANADGVNRRNGSPLKSPR